MLNTRRDHSFLSGYRRPRGARIADVETSSDDQSIPNSSQVWMTSPVHPTPYTQKVQPVNPIQCSPPGFLNPIPQTQRNVPVDPAPRTQAAVVNQIPSLLPTGGGIGKDNYLI